MESLSESIPTSNPFPQKFFLELTILSVSEPSDLDFDDLGIDELIVPLNRTNIEAVLSDFSSQFKGGKEDLVIHFYETFLSNYDSTTLQKEETYTPKPVVDFIVRSVMSIIDDHDLPLGLADTSTHLVDVVKNGPKL